MEKRVFTKISTINLRDRIEAELREAIISGKFKPGQKLVEYDIAKQFEVSRAPVREALSALQNEGLVIDKYRRGYLVPELSEKDIDEIYDIRILLEFGGVKAALNKMTEDNFDILQKYINRLGILLKDSNKQKEITKIDISIHEYIMSCSKNNRLHKIWNSIRSQCQLLIGITSQTYYDLPEQPQIMHQRLLDSLKTYDLSIVESELTEHFTDAKRRAKLSLEKYNLINN